MIIFAYVSYWAPYENKVLEYKVTYIKKIKVSRRKQNNELNIREVRAIKPHHRAIQVGSYGISLHQICPIITSDNLRGYVATKIRHRFVKR